MSASSRGLSRLGTLPVVVAVLTLITAAYYSLVAFSNITDFGTNQEFVKHVFAMDTTFNDPDVTWRSIGSSAIPRTWHCMVTAVPIAATTHHHRLCPDQARHAAARAMRIRFGRPAVVVDVAVRGFMAVLM